jgi:hypothetical protein
VRLRARLNLPRRAEVGDGDGGCGGMLARGRLQASQALRAGRAVASLPWRARGRAQMAAEALGVSTMGAALNAHRRGAPRLRPNSCVRLHMNDEEDGKLIVTIPTSSAAR